MIKHGGDIYSYQYSGEILDFSANISPLGVPDSAKRAVMNAFQSLKHYPDPKCGKLRRALGKYHNISPEKIVCGNGAADIIFRAAKALSPKSILIPSPTFGEYGEAFEQQGAKVKYYAIPYPFDIGKDLIDTLAAGDYDLLILCNPNNPTGKIINEKILHRIAELSEEKGFRILLDECFFDMTDYADLSMINHINNCRSLIIIKSLTKMYALAGLRIGYAISSDTELIEKISLTGQPWPVNTLASEAACAVLGDREYRDRFLELIGEEKSFLYSELAGLGFEVWYPAANYVFFRAKGFSRLDNELKKQGILIRCCDDYRGLSHEYYRAAVRLHEDNAYLIKILRKIVMG